MAAQRAADEHMKAQALGLAPMEVKGVVAPTSVPKDERHEHELTHTPAMPWCESCIRGAGTERPHVEDLTEASVPLVVLDFAHNACEGEER